MKQNYYEPIMPQRLQEYAVVAGFGDSYPVDLQEFEKFLGNSKTILEVGCGTGRLGVHLIKKFEYVGIDVHEPYLRFFKERLRGQNIVDLNKHIVQSSFLDFGQKGFDAVLFPWTVIGDFGPENQVVALKKAYSILNDGGRVLLDNPAKETEYNKVPGYTPAKFYYDDWKDTFNGLGFSRHSVLYYKTLTGRKREITVLSK